MVNDKMKKRSLKTSLIVYIWLGILSSFLYLQLLLGATRIIDINRFWIHNIMICYMINILVFNIFKNKKVLYLITGIAFLWSVISHFVLQLHGSALCFSLFKNFKTAMTVIDNYKILEGKEDIFQFKKLRSKSKTSSLYHGKKRF